MRETCFALFGDICYSIDKNSLVIANQSYLVCEEGKTAGIYDELPKDYQDIPCIDYSDALIIPGLVDLHLHAPQFGFRGLGMDMALLEWLETNAFPEEAKFSDEAYAKKAYTYFADTLKRSATTRAVIFATVHGSSTDILMSCMEETGLKSYVGKVNMDRNGPEFLCEVSAKASLGETRTWLETTKEKYEHVKPILTPRFIPTCTDALMAGLGEIQKEYSLPLQSHLSENTDEIDWVQALCPDTKFYGDAYDKFDLFGGDCPTIMAHCVLSSEEEVSLMKKKGVYIAHCPQSNTNLSSGIAPIKQYLEKGLRVGLGSDIAGGFSESIFRAMSDAIQVSKFYSLYVDKNERALTMEEVFYMGTKGGGEFFGKVGSFEKGYAFDALVLREDHLMSTIELTTKQRLERLIYLSDDRNIVDKYVEGSRLFDGGK